MRIACLQFAPQVGDVDNNLNRADAVLSKANPQNLDLLVLPELAFSGYNFKSLQQISPYLEPTTSGITSLWARTTALKYECVVTVGYPEKVDITPKWPASPEYYNSAITVNADGETIANYRKSFLYYTDETWALEGPDGFFDGEIEGLGNVAMGICKWPTKSFERDPYKFEAPWSAWEFAYHILHKEANLVILSMAWLTRENARSYSRCPKDPDMDTLSYWLARLEPLIRAETEGELICVFANRSGTEEEAVYAGTSAVLGIHAGEVKVYGILGRGEKELLVVDTNKRPQAKLVSEPNSTASDVKDDQGDIKGDRKDVKPSEKVGKVEKAEKDEKVEKAEKAEKAENIEKPEKAEEAEKAEKPEKAERNTTAEYNADSSAEASTDERTNSTVSDMSDLSVNTQVTACTTPDFPNVCFPKSMEDVVTPLSPVDANSPSAFFAPRSRRPDGDTLRESLKSKEQVTRKGSPVIFGPPSPKSRNASRTRQPEYQELALASHDLAKEEQITYRSIGIQSPVQPHSAAAALDRYNPSFSPTHFSSRRSISLSPRPKSTVW
ncbi:carbon-nitrogen hydrolase [Hyaloscypha finlandica]|nr:carbon-nitrogen hydrolase [Hyaloscypha finlandica]